ncbi:MAG: polysaccharide deacetylase family protein [Bacteroidetes bacterium]|nr:polysaccharide deacetylase family protein [Bacteroidota bacterium]
MDTTSASDEGEPANNNHSYFRILVFCTCIAFLFSCKQPKKELPPAPPPGPDTLVIEKKPAATTDTIAKKPMGKKKIYLTFDDGPNKGTRNVLQVSKEENVPISFFIVGKHVFDSPEQKATWELLKADTSIVMCNHSYTHAGGQYTRFYSNPAGVVADIRSCQEKLAFPNYVVRMPGRNAWRIADIRVTDIKESRAAIDSVYQAGFDVMGWDIEWSFDHKTLSPDTATGILLRRIRNMLDAGTTKTPGHLVLLAHDQAFQKTNDISMLVSFLRELKSNEDYEFILAGKYPRLRRVPE